MTKKLMIVLVVIACGIGFTVFSGHSSSKKAVPESSQSSTVCSSSSSESFPSTEASSSSEPVSDDLEVVNAFVQAYYNYDNSTEQRTQCLTLCSPSVIKALALDSKTSPTQAKSELKTVKIGVTKDKEYLCLVQYDFSGMGIRPDLMIVKTKVIEGKTLIDSVELPKAD